MLITHNIDIEVMDTKIFLNLLLNLVSLKTMKKIIGRNNKFTS